MEGSAWQHHPKYLEPSSVCNYFFHTPHLSASWRQRLHLQALFFLWHLPSLHHSPARTTLDATTPWTMALYVTVEFLVQRLQTRHGWSNGHHPAVSARGSESTDMRDRPFFTVGGYQRFTTIMEGRAVTGSGHGG